VRAGIEQLNAWLMAQQPAAPLPNLERAAL
jgi:hypothetical protein